MPPSLDHLILFVPASPKNDPIVPGSLSAAFTLTPGGTHADKLTANTLILLADGCYIELICFLPSTSADQTSKIKSHWWGPDPHRRGWADWCLTTSSPSSANYDAVKASHAEPVNGARNRADGVRVEWAVTFPKGEMGGQTERGEIPFFCHDVTPRRLRVPLDEASTQHACGAMGVRSLTVVVGTQSRLDELRALYGSLFESDGTVKGDEAEFEAGRVEHVQELGTGARIVLRLARGEEELQRVQNLGFWVGDVVLAAKADEEKESGQRQKIDGLVDGIGGLWVEYV